MANVYLEGLKRIMQGDIDLEAGSIKALLLETGCTFTETHATVTAVLAVGGGEFDATAGYARQTLTTPAASVSGAMSKFASDNVSFSSVNSADTAIAMLIYWDSGGGDGTCIPIAYCDGADEAFTAGNLKTLIYNCPANGWFNIVNS
jgi:hypothetical protein